MGYFYFIKRSGFLGHLEISSMISDTYQSFNKEYLPNK